MNEKGGEREEEATSDSTEARRQEEKENERPEKMGKGEEKMERLKVIDDLPYRTFQSSGE